MRSIGAHLGRVRGRWFDPSLTGASDRRDGRWRSEAGGSRRWWFDLSSTTWETKRKRTKFLHNAIWSFYFRYRVSVRIILYQLESLFYVINEQYAPRILDRENLIGCGKNITWLTWLVGAWRRWRWKRRDPWWVRPGRGRWVWWSAPCPRWFSSFPLQTPLGWTPSQPRIKKKKSFNRQCPFG